MEFQYAIGVDVSKGWLNFCVQDQRFEILFEGECDNTPADIEQFPLGRRFRRHFLLPKSGYF